MPRFLFWAFALTLAGSGCDDAAVPENAAQIQSSTVEPATPVGSFPPAMRELGDLTSAGSRMAGHAYLANGPGPHPTVVLLHGFPGNEKNLDLAQSLRAAGWNALFFHYRGAWGSEGAFSFRNALEDAQVAVDYVRTNADALRADPGRVVMIGHSMGGFVALQASADDVGLSCTVAISPADMFQIATAFVSNESIREQLLALEEDLYMLRGLDMEAALVSLLQREEPLTELGPRFIDRKVLVVASRRDQVISVRAQQMVAHAFREYGNIHVTEKVLDTDHSFSWMRENLANTIIEWLDQNCSTAVAGARHP